MFLEDFSRLKSMRVDACSGGFPAACDVEASTQGVATGQAWLLHL